MLWLKCGVTCRQGRRSRVPLALPDLRHGASAALTRARCSATPLPAMPHLKTSPTMHTWGRPLNDAGPDAGANLDAGDLRGNGRPGRGGIGLVRPRLQRRAVRQLWRVRLRGPTALRRSPRVGSSPPHFEDYFVHPSSATALASSTSYLPLGKRARCTPQCVHARDGSRSCRVRIEPSSNDNRSSVTAPTANAVTASSYLPRLRSTATRSSRSPTSGCTTDAGSRTSRFGGGSGHRNDCSGPTSRTRPSSARNRTEPRCTRTPAARRYVTVKGAPTSAWPWETRTWAGAVVGRS